MNNCQHSYSIPLETHKPISVAFAVVDRNGDLMNEFYYTGDDVVERFVTEVLKCEKDLLEITRMNKYMVITDEEQQEFDSASICYICKNNQKGKYNPFTQEADKVRDHCHVTGTWYISY